MAGAEHRLAPLLGDSLPDQSQRNRGNERSAVDASPHGPADQGTAPALPDLVHASETHLKNAKTRLAAALKAHRGEVFSVLGETFTNARTGAGDLAASQYVRDDDGGRRDLVETRDNLIARIIEAEREGWLGEAEGLRVSLAAIGTQLAQPDERARRAATINLDIPTYRDIVGRTA